MILGAVLLILIVVGLFAISYRGALHEFQILQKDYNSQNKWQEFLSEQLPLVIRNLPPTWLGNWSASRTENKDWQVTISIKEGRKTRKLQTSFKEWLEYPEKQIENGTELGHNAKLDITVQNWFRRWFWIPTNSPRSHILSGHEDNSCLPLRKTTADSTVIVSTDGAPIEIWISHEAGIPSPIVDEIRGKNPWIQSTNEIPGVEEVKFIEVVLRPGNAIVIPTHWWYSIRSTDDSALSWFWINEFHSPISWLATTIQNKN